MAFAWLLALSVFDARWRRLPNWLTLPGAVAVLIFAIATGRGLPALWGGLALFGIYLLIHLMAPAAMGPGDVKLALGVGALTGYFGAAVWAFAAVTAPVLTAGWGLISLALRGWRRRAIPSGAAPVNGRALAVPHGPAMCAATAVAIALALI